MDPRELFHQIEKLDLHLQEPRFECQVRAHIIGKFLRSKGLQPGRIWALAREGTKIIAPLRDLDGKPFPSIATDVCAEGKPILHEDESRLLEWTYHVAACDISDPYHPVIYDPAMFSGPVTLTRWMSAFCHVNRPIFIRTEFNTGPRYNYMGSAYTPDLQHEHGPDDDQRAALDLMVLKARSPHGVPYSRLDPKKKYDR